MKTPCLLLLIIVGFAEFSAGQTEFWHPPFDTTKPGSKQSVKRLSLDDAIQLTASRSPFLKSLNLKHLVVRERLRQAGLWSNPEMATEFEEVGWDARGLSESEITISLSQEFQLFGKRGANKELIRRELDLTQWQSRIAAFDLYETVKERFYTVAFAQRQVELAIQAVELNDSISTTIEHRVQRGAALESELLLAKLEFQRAQLSLLQAKAGLSTAVINLEALWKGNSDDLSVIDPEFDIAPPFDSSSIIAAIDSSRNVNSLNNEKKILTAAANLARAEARPNINLTGGFKRLESNRSNSFVFGLSMPLPFFDRNQGIVASLEAQLRALDYEKEQSVLETKAEIQTAIKELRQLLNRYELLENKLIPQAETAYRSLRDAYLVGRISYPAMLEGGRALIELQFELNAAKLNIRSQRISIERITGIILE